MTANQTEPRQATRRMTDCEFDLAIRWFLAVSRAA
jgi:hypothetical protein